MEEEETAGCIKELKRLIRHHKKDVDEYSAGIVDGFGMAIEILNHKEFYGEKEKKWRKKKSLHS